MTLSNTKRETKKRSTHDKKKKRKEIIYGTYNYNVNYIISLCSTQLDISN